jgi:hypothetical protein
LLTRFDPDPRHIPQHARELVRPCFGLQLQANRFQVFSALHGSDKVIRQIILLRQGHPARINP